MERTLTPRHAALREAVERKLGADASRLPSTTGEVGFRVSPGRLLHCCRLLRDDPELKFEMLMDLCGVDYLHYGRDEWQTDSATATGFSRGVLRRQGAPADEVDREHTAEVPERRFAVVYQLLSVTRNHRIRLKVFCEDEQYPLLDSVTEIWASANWYEREAFDLFGILFRGHPDLRRLLTDYGFIGHPFRKDFPLIGNVEVRYDPEKGRVIYEPVSIEPRTLVPKVIRDDPRYRRELKD